MKYNVRRMNDRSRSPVGVWTLVGATLCTSLACQDPTQVTLLIRTDIPCAYQPTTTITAGVLGEIEYKPPATETAACTTGDAGALVDFGSLAAEPSGDDDDQVAFKVATSLTSGACNDPLSGDCVTARRALNYRPNEDLQLPIAMRGTCGGIACDATTTCEHGLCVPAVVPGESCLTGLCNLQPYGYGGNGNVAHAVSADSDGNVYATGEFEGSITFGGVAYQSVGAKDGFFVKVNASGLTELSQTHDDQVGQAMTVAASCTEPAGGEPVCTEKVYVAGQTSDGIFVEVLDRQGATEATVRIAAGGPPEVSALAVDLDRNVYVTGSFTGQIEPVGAAPLVSENVISGFVLKLDDALGYLDNWLVSNGSHAKAHGVAVDALGNMWLSAMFSGGINFYGTALKAEGGTDILLARFDPSGALQAATRLGNVHPDYAGAIAIDVDGSALLSGTIDQPATFGDGGGSDEGILPSGSSRDAFAARFSYDANEPGKLRYITAHTLDAHVDDLSYGEALALGPDGTVFLAGEYAHKIVGPSGSPGTFELPDAFVAALDVQAEGGVTWLRSYGNDEADIVNGLVHTGAALYLAGRVEGGVLLRVPSTAPGL